MKIDVVSEKHIIAAKKKLYTQLQHHKYVDDFTNDTVSKDQFGTSRVTDHALDFIKCSTGYLYFVEGNITPGVNWFDDEDERHAKQLMRLIIKNLKKW